MTGTARYTPRRAAFMRVVATVMVCLCAQQTAGAQQQWRIERDVVVGDGDDRALFSDIRAIVAGPTGNIFVLDFKDQDIRMFDAKGAFVRTIARRGQGPGELGNANGMLLTKDGTLWVNDQLQRRWSAFSATTGNFVRQVRLPILSFGFLWEPGMDNSGRIIDRISVAAPGRAGSDGTPTYVAQLRRVNVNAARVQAAADTSTIGPPADTVAYTACSPRTVPKVQSFTGYDTSGRAMGFTGVPFLPRLQIAFGLDGTLWCSATDEYAIVHRNVGANDTLHVIRATFPALAVTSKERDDAIANANKFLARYARKDMDVSAIPATKPIISALSLDRTGRVWVRRTAPPSEAGTTWEVYDATGRRIATATAPFKIRSAVAPFITENAMYVIVVDDDGVPTVLRAKIVR